VIVLWSLTFFSFFQCLKFTKLHSYYLSTAGGKKTEASGDQLGIAKPAETSGFNPMKSKYHPIDDASWEKDKP
jgi:hypothetical protein